MRAPPATPHLRARTPGARARFRQATHVPGAAVRVGCEGSAVALRIERRGAAWGTPGVPFGPRPPADCAFIRLRVHRSELWVHDCGLLAPGVVVWAAVPVVPAHVRRGGRGPRKHRPHWDARIVAHAAADRTAMTATHEVQPGQMTGVETSKAAPGTTPVQTDWALPEPHVPTRRRDAVLRVA